MPAPASPTNPPLPATVRALGWTSFLTDLSGEAIYPLLPAFITRELGGTAATVGVIDGIANAVAALTRLPSGAISDAAGRRPLILTGYGVSALVRPLMAFVGSPVGVLLVRAADRFGKGIRSAPRDALVTDLVAAETRGSAFGHIRAMDHLGAALGPLVALVFLLVFPGAERTLFLLALLPGVATLAVIAALVRDPPRSAPLSAKTALAGGLSRGQWLLLGAVAVWALGAASEQFYLLRAADMGVESGLVPAVWFGVGLVKSALARVAGTVVARVGALGALAAGWLLFAAAHVGLAMATTVPTTLLAIALVAAASGLAEPAERTLVAQLSPGHRVGAAFGWYTLVQGMFGLVAGILVGAMWNRQGAEAAFVLTATFATLACALLLGVVRPLVPPLTPPGAPS